MFIHNYFNSRGCPRSKCSVRHMGNVSQQLTLLTFDPALSATRLVVWQYARATQVCPVEASTPMCSVTASVPLFLPLSQRLGMGLLRTLLGELSADMWECLNKWTGLSSDHYWACENRCIISSVTLALSRVSFLILMIPLIWEILDPVFFGAWPILGTQIHHISASAALILTF